MPDDATPDVKEEIQELAKRLELVTGQRNQAKDDYQILVTENQALQQRLKALEDRLTTPAKEKRTDVDRFDDSVPSGKAGASLDPGSIASLVEAAVAKATQPIVQKFENDSKEVQLRTAQQESFNRAVELMPDLADEGSDLSKLTNQLFSQQPDLAKHQNGPVILATMAKGLLAGSRTISKTEIEKKRNAAVQRPQSRSFDDLEKPRPEQAAQYEREIVEKSEKEGTTPEDFADIFRLNLEKVRSSE